PSRKVGTTMHGARRGPRGGRRRPPPRLGPPGKPQSLTAIPASKNSRPGGITRVRATSSRSVRARRGSGGPRVTLLVAGGFPGNGRRGEPTRYGRHGRCLEALGGHRLSIRESPRRGGE